MNYIERDGHRFTPAYDENGNIIKTAEETYADWKAGKNHTGETPADTTEERLAALEEENKHLREALDLLLSGETEEGEADG